MYTVESLGKQVVEMNANRKHFSRTAEELARAVQVEIGELVGEINEAFVTDNAWAVIGEIGDVYILMAQLCEELGVNPADAMHMKMTRNERKYPDYTMNNGHTPQEAATLAKESWKYLGGDPVFSHAYLDLLAYE